MLGKFSLVAVLRFLMAASDEVIFDIVVEEKGWLKGYRVLIDPYGTVRRCTFLQRQDLPELGPVISATGGFRGVFAPDFCPKAPPWPGVLAASKEDHFRAMA